MREVLFRCSGIGHIMGDAQQIDENLRTPEIEKIIAKTNRTDEERALIKSLKARTLSATAKTFIRQMAAEDIFGVDFSVSSREMQKGIQCEDASIALYNAVFGKSLTKNSERRTDEYLTGESDLPDADEVADIKTAWSIATFPLSEDDVSDTQRKLYEWQVRAYMRLWNKPRGRVVYCLVDTPEELCKWEDASLHMVSHIPDHMRVTTWAFARDAELEAQMIDKIKCARAYYAHVVQQFHVTHQLCAEAGLS